jgi:hypothetical protein
LAPDQFVRVVSTLFLQLNEPAEECILLLQKYKLLLFLVNKRLHAATDHSSPASLILLPEGNVDRVGKKRGSGRSRGSRKGRGSGKGIRKGLRWCRRCDQAQERT